MPASIVLLSAGLDSAVNLKRALDEGGVAAALTFDYGQRAARQETRSSRAMSARLRFRHEVITLPWLARITRQTAGGQARCALVARREALPHPNEADLDDPAAAAKSASRVWVPNRNGVFLAIAAAWAEALGADQVVAGFNAEEAATFPDNSAEFIRAYTRSLRLSTKNAVKVKSYTARLRKPAIVALGLRIGAPMDLVWCCYEGGRRMCGRCESCMRFLRAVRKARAEKWFRSNHPRMPATKGRA